MEASIFECFFEEADYEFKDISEMSLKQLVIYKKQLQNLNQKNFLTNSQEISLEKFKKQLFTDYPETIFNASEEEAKKSIKIRTKELNAFKAECHKINKILYEGSQDQLNKINILEEQLRNESEEKYKQEHKVYLNEKIKCECGMMTIRKNKSTHKKSKVHLMYEAKLEEEKQMKLQKQKKEMERKEKERKEREAIPPKDERGFTIVEGFKFDWM